MSESMLQRELRRPLDRMLYDLLLPSARGALAKGYEYWQPRQLSYDQLIDEQQHWLRDWIPLHRHDYKQCFLDDSINWVRQRMLDPGCYIPFVLTPEMLGLS